MVGLGAMTVDEALAAIRGLASVRRYEVSVHARKRRAERGVQPEDLHHALCRARRAQAQAGRGTWKASGPDTDGDDLDLIVGIDGDLVVTVF